MRQRKTMKFWIPGLMALVVLLAAACSGGDVSQEDFDALQADKDNLQSQLQAKDSDLTQAQSAKTSIESQLQSKEADLTAAQADLATLQDAAPPAEFPFGITVETFDASGPAAYDVVPGQLLAFVQSGMTYGSPADANYTTVIDVATREILAQAAAPLPEGYKSHGMAVSADGAWIYLPSLTGGSTKIHILDARTLKLAKTLDVGDRTHHVDEGSYKQPGFIIMDTSGPHGHIVIDTATNEVVGEMRKEIFEGRTYSSWSSPDGSFAYVTLSPHRGSGNSGGWIAKIDLETFEEIQAIPVGPSPVWVAFAKDGKTAWVSNSGDGTVSQIKIAQTEDEVDEVIATVDLNATQSYGLVLTDDGKKLYAVRKYTNDAEGNRIPGASVAVVDTATLTVVKEITVGAQPDHLFLSPDGSEVWVGENRGYKISIISTVTDTVIDTIDMPGDTHTIEFVQY